MFLVFTDCFWIEERYKLKVNRKKKKKKQSGPWICWLESACESSKCGARKGLKFYVNLYDIATYTLKFK